MAEERTEQRNADGEIIVAAGLTAAQIAALPKRGAMALDDLLELLARDAERVTRQAALGEITVSQWEAEMRRIIKSAHNGSAMFARGGRAMGIVERLKEWATRQRRIAEDFNRLRGFVNDLLSGRYPTDSSLGAALNRAKLYVNASRQTYSDVKERLAVQSGMLYKQRILEPTADHCEDCIQQAAYGRVPINDPRVTLVGVGVACGANDACDIRYFDTAEG